MTAECEEIVFWTLRKKFVDSHVCVQEKKREVMYYSLAMGHHVGVIDCLTVALRCPVAQYQAWISLIGDGPARRKMAGVFTFGEIMIDASHTATLTPAFAALAKDAGSPYRALSLQLLRLLAGIVREPAIYLMAKKIS